MTIKKMVSKRMKRPTKRSLEEELDFLKQLAEKHIPYSCFKEHKAVQDAYKHLRSYIRDSSYRDKK
tara:strand:- start:1036 stop:1233 length:198 start_codon:yes stop_codon:yes gene_type:complete